jgi:hypothetical protein
MILIKPGYAGITFELPDDTIIADIGFGHDPVRGATYYIDKDTGESAERGGRKAVDVPPEKFISADVSEGIPLPDKSCDFVVASHIVEHMDDPGFFCSELSRVGKAGYIETPGMMQELRENREVHKWFVTKRGDTLIFIRKRGVFKGPWLVPAWFPVIILLYLFRQTCFHWKDNIKIKVIQ